MVYLRVENPAVPILTRQISYGLDVAFGKEARGICAGASEVTTTTPADDAFTFVDFNSEQPFQTQAFVWKDSDLATEHLSISQRILEEIKP